LKHLELPFCWYEGVGRPAKASAESGGVVKAKAHTENSSASSGDTKAETGSAKAESDGVAASSGDRASVAVAK